MPRHRPAPPPPTRAEIEAADERRLLAEGAEAFRAGVPMTENPYRDQPDNDRWIWQRGWVDAQVAARSAGR